MFLLELLRSLLSRQVFRAPSEVHHHWETGPSQGRSSSLSSPDQSDDDEDNDASWESNEQRDRKAIACWMGHELGWYIQELLLLASDWEWYAALQYLGLTNFQDEGLVF